MSSEEDGLAFPKITDAIVAVNKKVNLIGVVREFGVPKNSKGTDWFCKLKIVDQSHWEPGLSVNLFAENSQKLPHIESAGDIIQLSDVVIRKHEQLVNAFFNKKISSFALYKGKDGIDFHPYQVSSRFYPRKEARNFIVGLRKWVEIDQDPKDFMLLREIKEGKGNNLICKVLHVCNVSEEEQMAFIWDGTDTPPISIQSKLEDEMVNSLPLRIESLPLSRDILCTFPVTGTILRVIVEKRDLCLHIDKWMKFIGLTCEISSGLWYGKLTKSTKLRYLLEDDCIVQERQRSYKDRVLSNWDRMSSWAFPWPLRITEIENDDVPIVTLMEVLTSSKVVAKFHCAVRIVAMYPCCAEDFRSPAGTYRIRLTLEDQTARIHAFVYAEDGEAFFNGYPSVDELTRKRNKLTGSEDGKELRNPPFVECCLKSYYTDKSDVWGSRQYRVFGTKVVC